MSHYASSYEDSEDVYRKTKNKKYAEMRVKINQIFTELDDVIDEMCHYEEEIVLIRAEVYKFRALLDYTVRRGTKRGG